MPFKVPLSLSLHPELDSSSTSPPFAITIRVPQRDFEVLLLEDQSESLELIRCSYPNSGGRISRDQLATSEGDMRKISRANTHCCILRITLVSQLDARACGL